MACRDDPSTSSASARFQEAGHHPNGPHFCLTRRSGARATLNNSNAFDVAPRVFARLLAAVCGLLPACAVAQEAESPVAVTGQNASSRDQGAGPEGDVLSAQRLLQLMYQVKTAPGTDLDGNPVTTTTDTWKLRADETFNLSQQWSLALRGDLPFLAKDKYTASNVTGDFLYGLGDADVQAALIDNIDARWKAGAGARLIAPTGDSALTSGLWRIMPIVGVRYGLPGISSGSYFEPLARYDVSFAGDPTKKFISNLQLAPMLNLSLPDRWFLTLYPNPEIRWNFGAPVTGQTGRLFLPVDARIGKKFSESINVSLEVSVPIVKDYPVYDFMTALRINFSF
jgi:hypothetical protein